MKTGYYDNRSALNSHALGSNRLGRFAGSRATSPRRSIPAASLAMLNEIKGRVTQQLDAAYGDLVSPTLLKQAVQEAEAIAATTTLPVLFLPALAEEKVQIASAWGASSEANPRTITGFRGMDALVNRYRLPNPLFR